MGKVEDGLRISIEDLVEVIGKDDMLNCRSTYLLTKPIPCLHGKDQSFSILRLYISYWFT